MKVAIYTRKSKYTEEGESIENQINMCIEYAKNMLGVTDYEIYEDEGFSGGNIDRPQFKKLMKDIKIKEFTHLICYRLDRISRNVADFSATLEMLNKLNISFVSIKERFDTSSAMGRAMMNISATFAQFERETIAERIKDNLRELAKTGRWLGGPPPLGYKSIEVKNNDSNGKGRKKHILEINPAEIEMIKTLFKLFLEHKKYNTTANLLNNLGFKPRHGKVFNLTIVKQAINNPTYVIADKKIFNYFNTKGCSTYLENKFNGQRGIMPYHRRDSSNNMLDQSEWIIAVGDHQGIITSDEWIKCQEIKEKIKNRSSNRDGTSKLFLLSGLMVCKCGSSMSGRYKKVKDKEYRYYTCNLRNRNSKECNNDALNAQSAEDAVVDHLKKITLKIIISNYNKTKHENKKKIDNIKIIEQYTREIEENKIYIRGLVKKMAVENDEDLLQDYKNERKSLKFRNIELQSMINDFNCKNNNIKNMEENLDDLLALFDEFKKFYNFTKSFEDKQRLIKDVVKFISWDSETRYLDIVLVGSYKKKPVVNQLFHL